MIGDLATTFVGLSLGAAETNPLADTLIGGFGPWVLIPIDLALVGVTIVANNLAVIYVLLL